MNRDQFLSYIDDYNTGQLDMLRSHYTDDIVFENYGGHHAGEEVFEFIGGLMDTLSTKIMPEIVLVDGDQIALYGDMEILALCDQTNPALGSVKKGERKVARTFVFYDTIGPKISHIRIAGWPGVDVAEEAPAPAAIHR